MTRLFGTNGIRWKPDESDDHNFAIKLGFTAGHYFGKGKSVCVGMDARTTGPMIKAAVSSGMMAAGCNVVDLGMVSTPTVQLAVRKQKVDGGIVVSASHNPPEFNGLKFVASDGTELARDEEKVIEKLFDEGAACANWLEVGKQHTYHNSKQDHIDHVLSQVRPDDSWKKLKVVVDGANGPGGDLTPRILARLGCEVITINAQPDGMFPGRMPEPIKANLGGLMKAVKDSGADLGIAHDGDADRAMFIDENGIYINGNKSFGIFTSKMLVEKKGRVVLPVNTSKIVTDTVEQMGGMVELTPIGSPLIARRMMEVGAVFGGEGNGGVIFPEIMYCRDGMMSAAKMVEILATGPPLSTLVQELPKYQLIRSKIDCPNSLKMEVISELQKKISVQTVNIDGLKIIDDQWWVLLRPSGTEPIFRVTAEARELELAKSKLDEYKKLADEVISALLS